ncbi:SPERT protein, partial [Galbula dea]|nr:SPERT protein [Galbula dea]
MSACDLTKQSMQCPEPETGYMVPQIKLGEEVFVFLNGKWVKEICCQPPFATGQKLLGKKAQKEWSIWEENRVLWEENQVLQNENRMLWEENKALKCLLSQNKAAQVIYTDAFQQSLQKETKPFPFTPERNMGSQVSPVNQHLQAVQETYRALEDFQQENKTVPIIWKEQKAITAHEESKGASSALQEDTVAITSVEDDYPGPVAQEAEEKSITSTQSNIKPAPSMQGEYGNPWSPQELHELFLAFLKLNPTPEEMSDVNRSFEEDYNKLKLQLNAVKNTVSDIMVQMEMLEKELVAITSPTSEEAEQELAAEYQLGD